MREYENKTIIMVNHYGAQEKYLGFSRYPNWGKYLVSQGYNVYIVCDANIHNSELSMVGDNEYYHIVDDYGVKYVYVKTSKYNNNGFSRIKNLLSFYVAAKKTLKNLPKANVIIAQSPNPLACVAAIQYSKTNDIACICDVVDLWPESIVVYNHVSRKNPIIKMLYLLEKWIYKKSDALIFSMAGGYKYIQERGWDNQIPKEKVFHINTGVDLNAFDHKKESCTCKDYSIDDKSFKVVYSGAVRLVNGLQLLVEAGEIIQDEGYREISIRIHGAGDYVEELKEYCSKNHIHNVFLYGRILKDDIPYVLSHADLCILCYQNTPLLKYGGSMNKMFDYFASGKPVISNAKMGYSLIDEYGCGVELNTNNPKILANEIIRFYKMKPEELQMLGRNSRKAAEDYDIQKLGQQLMDVILFADLQ